MTVGKSVIGNVDDAVMQGEGSVESASVEGLGRYGGNILWDSQRTCEPRATLESAVRYSLKM